MYAFSKDERFKPVKSYTNAFGYEIPGQFGWKKDDAAGRGFGSSVHDRFGYEEGMKERRGKLTSKLDGPDQALLEFTKRRTFSFSFGVSRSNMKKIHVDEILKKKDENLPGPERY